MATAEQVMERRAEVEALLLKGAWTLRAQMALARRHKVLIRAVQRDAAHIRRKWAKAHKKVSPEEARAGFIERVRAAQLDASKNGAHFALGRMMYLEANVCGHNQPLQVEVTHRAETMSPIEQAKLIVSKAGEARAFLEDVAPEELTQLEPNVIEVTCE